MMATLTHPEMLLAAPKNKAADLQRVSAKRCLFGACTSGAFSLASVHLFVQKVASVRGVRQSIISEFNCVFCVRLVGARERSERVTKAACRFRQLQAAAC